MKPGKYISAAKSQFQILLISLIVSSYVSIAYLKDFELLNSARDDVSEWLYYERIKKDYDPFKAFEESYKTYYQYVPISSLLDEDYAIIGKVWFYAKDSNVEIVVNKPDKNQQEGFYGTYHNLYHWERFINPSLFPLLSDTNFNSERRQTLKSALDLNYEMIINPLDSLRKANPKKFKEETKDVNPSWYEEDALEIDIGSEQLIKERHLKYLAETYDIPVSQKDTVPNVYHAIERHYYENSFTIPIIDIKFQAIVASWIITAILFLLLISFQNKIQIAEEFYNSEDSEPWSLFDSFRGLPKILVVAITTVIALIPLIAVGNLLFVFYLSNKLDGFVYSAFYLICSILFFIVLFILFTLSTIKTLKNIKSIRKKSISAFS